MPEVRLIQTNFTAGEWSPRLAGHVDLQKRANACEELQNVIVWPHGGVTRRMGTRFRGHIKAGNTKPLLKDFSFNDIQTYVLEFGARYVRFWRDGGQIMRDDGKPLEVSLPYSADEVHELGFAQSADVLFICHAKYLPQKLVRHGPDVFTLVPCEFLNQPEEWTHSNWPSRVNLHQQRTWWTGCPNHPQKLWFSATGNFLEMGGEAKEDDSGAGFSLDSDQVNQIRGLVAARNLVCLTSGGEWTLSGGNESISPTNVQATRYSNVGCAAHVPPMLIGSAVLFMSRDRKKLREFIYNLEQDGFVPLEASLLSEHLLRPQVKQLAWQQDPDSIVWCVLDDGTLAAMTYLRDQQVYAWHRHTTQGKVLSVCANSAEDYTEIWLAVERNGKVCMEQMANPWQGDNLDDADCFFVDSGLSYQGSKLSSVSGLDHLNGMTVQVLADGGVQKEKVVQNGRIDLDFPADTVVVGLGYEYRVTPLQPEGGSPLGTGQGVIKRMSKVTIRTYKSVGMHYKIGDDTEKDIFLRNVNKAMEKPVQPFTGDLELPSVGTGWDSNPTVSVFGSDPLPFSLLALIRQVEVTA